MHLVRSTLAALVAAAWAGSALAGTSGWATTHTAAHEVYSAATGERLAPQEEVAPGEALHLVVTLQLRNRADLDHRVARIRAGSRADLLQGGQAQALYLPTPAQAQALVDHLTRAGFRNIEVAPNRLLVSADGSAAMAKAAFDAELHWHGAGEERRFANTTPARVPAELADVVLAVHGLQNASSFHTMAQVLDVTPQANVGHSPTDFPLIYNANGLPAASNTVLGIISEGNMSQTLADLAAFTTKAGYPAANAQVVQVGAAGSDTSGTVEWDLDSQDALAAAGGQLKQMLFYTATSLQDGPITQAYNKAVSDHLAQVVNVSLGECETAAKSSGVEASNDQIFALAVAQGQTFSVSTGDSGSRECGRFKGNKQSYPAVSPYVMAIGGTTLSTTGNTTWAGETVWSGTGGGASTTEAAPSYQRSSGVIGSSTMRGVPDISFDANPSTGAIILVNGRNTQVGGTSLSAPLFAGFWARLQNAHGNALVFPAQALYQYGPSNPSLFHDVTSGNNGGYTAKAGWDYASGFGSVDIGALNSFIATHAGW